MAIFNEILTGRHNRSLQKLFAIKGSPPVRQLAGEIQPTVEIFRGVEDRVLEAWDRYTAVLIQAAVAAANSVVQIRNPAKSIIFVVEKIILNLGVAGSITIGQGQTTVDATNIATGFRMDARGRPTSTAVLSFGTTTAQLPVTPESHQLQANIEIPTIQTVNQEWPIAPGDALRFFATTVNVGLTVNLTWRERVLEESELSFGL